jgi:hypothetical protein
MHEEIEVDLSLLYVPHEWELIEVPIEGPLLNVSEGVQCLTICSSDGGFAQKFYERNQNINGLFFVDQEMVMMGFDRQYGVHSLRQLKEEWQGIPAGTVILLTFRGADEGMYTIGVMKGSL